MISATVLAIFFVPVFYVFVMRWLGSREDQAPADAAPAPENAPGPGPQP
jgi:hypothetical protein